MVFSSLIFIVYFLPAVLLLYFILPSKRNYILMLFSLVFYAFGEPIYIALLLISSTIDYIISKEIYKTNVNIRRKGLLVLSILMNIGLLSFFKYGNFIIETINGIFNSNIQNLNLSLPIGISFYTFQTLSYTIDVYRKKIKPQNKYTDFLLYVSMFPQLIAGPIVRYIDIEKQLSNRKICLCNIEKGTRRFIIGLSKKILLADQLSLLHEQLLQVNDSIIGYWVLMTAYALHIFFDFSGYSDMAIGLAKIFGFDLLENFKYPYISKSISEFWRRWHISLGNWFKDYLYFPLGGSRVSKVKIIRNLIIVWLLTGLWHGANWNYILWGLYFGVFIILEKSIKIKVKLPNIIKHIYTLLVVLFGWVLFAFESITDQISIFKGMFGFNLDLINNETIFYLKEYIIVILLGILFTVPIKIKKEIPYFIKVILYVVLFIISLSFIVDSSYSPFIYFRF